MPPVNDLRHRPWSRLLRLLRSRPLRRAWAALFLIGAVYLTWRQLAGMSVAAFLQALAQTAPAAVAGSITLTVASYLCLSGSEWLALRALGHDLGYLQAARVAIPAYALTNSAGFSPATGTALRLQLYAARGLSALQSAEVAMLAGAAVTVSGGVAAGLVIMADPGLGRAVDAGKVVASCVGALLAAPALLWFVAFRRGVPAWLGGRRPAPLSSRGRLFGLAAGLGDWATSAGALFLLLPQPELAAFPGYFVAYTAGCILSAATGVPGGIGVFEAIVLALTSRISAVHETAAALLLYRVIYSLGPLSLWSGFSALRRTFGYLARRRRVSPEIRDDARAAAAAPEDRA